jgi:hypothetical protein
VLRQYRAADITLTAAQKLPADVPVPLRRSSDINAPRPISRMITSLSHAEFCGAANALHVLSTRRGPRLATLGRAVALAMAAVSASRGNATVT